MLSSLTVVIRLLIQAVRIVIDTAFF
jgi:hypothetical protein